MGVQATLGEAAVVILAAVALVIACRAILRRVMRVGEADSVADTVMEPLAGVYGVLLAFLVGGVAQRAMQLRDAVQAEADAFQRVERIATELPEPLGPRLRHELEAYARSEAPPRGSGPADRTGAEVLNDIWMTLATFEPTHPRDGVLQSEALDGVRALSEQRLLASRANRYAHGPLIWLVLGVGSVSVLGVAVVAGVGDHRAPFFLTALTAVIAVTLYVFWALSRPLGAVRFADLVAR